MASIIIIYKLEILFKQRGCYSIGKKIEIGVKIFSDIYFVLNAEDKERIYSYLEELRDIVVLESSKKQQNEFMYGFD